MRILILIALLLLSKSAFAEIDYIKVENATIVNAIYWAEGGSNTRYPYGIVSINTNGNASYARKICMNTVRNNKKRFLAQTKFKDYIEFLGSRYAPIGAKNDPNNLNKNWVKNVKYYIQNPKEVNYL